MNRKRLHRVAQEFRGGFLDSLPSSRMCFVLSTALQGYLGFCGVPCELVEGKVGECHHFWLEVVETGDVLDVTADQFETPDGAKMPSVYIGPLPEWYKVKEECPLHPR